MARHSTAPHTIKLVFTSGKRITSEHTRERDARQQLAWCIADNGYATRPDAARMADSAPVGESLEVVDRYGTHVLTATITRTPKASA